MDGWVDVSIYVTSFLGARNEVVAVDTFLGDLHVLWDRPPLDRATLLKRDGSIALFDRFRSNVCNAGMRFCVLPLQATSAVALKLVAMLASKQIIPLPEVIYLDSAHEEGETLLELSLAWNALAPGGMLFGDDWLLWEDQDMGRTLEGAQLSALRTSSLHFFI